MDDKNEAGPIVWNVGVGQVELDRVDGAPLGFRHPRRPTTPWLLQEGADRWHTVLHRWGRGFVITDHGTFRWGAPDSVNEGRGELTTHTKLGEGLELVVTRRGGAELAEAYELWNRGAAPVEVRSLAISTPWRDVYDSAQDSLERACHAHVWIGGSWAWVLAEPMDGLGPVLGLTLREGALWSYSVESRNPDTGSNIRGHLMLQPTDHARNPAANGGQPVYTVPPGEALSWSWKVGFHEDRAAFLATTDPPISFNSYSAGPDEAITGVLQRPATVAMDGVPVATDGSAVRLERSHAGTAIVDVVEESGRAARTMVLFTDGLEAIVRRRVRVLLDAHRDQRADGLRRFAFLPVDSSTGLTMHSPDWPDWTDGAERVGMAVLLQQARRIGWVDAEESAAALDGYAHFARTHLIEADGTVLRGSVGAYNGSRLYNYPWLAHFFADHAVMFGRSEDLDLAVRILHRLAERGGTHFLAIGWAEAARRVAGLCRQAGNDALADEVEQPLRDSADWFVSQGMELVAHEVNYEQTIVSPLVTLLALYGRPDDEDHRAALENAVRWLMAFGGPQPHIRLNSVPIRHWDGYWFGREKLWGDVFPHYWSVVTATALSALPDWATTEASAEQVRRIWDASLADFAAADFPTCAYVFPSCIDGRPADRPDPLSNDQDWALALRLRSLPTTPA